MKAMKNIIASVLVIFGTIIIIQISFEESGASLFGAFCGYVMLLSISIGIFYSANKKNTKSNPKVSISEKLTNLESLRKRGLVTDEEYLSKSNLINSDLKSIRIQESKEYKEALSLFDNKVLSEEEFKRIVATIKSKLKDDNNELNIEPENNDGAVIVLGLLFILLLIFLYFTVVLGWR